MTDSCTNQGERQRPSDTAAAGKPVYNFTSLRATGKPSLVTHDGRIEKAFAFQKTDNGWRCNTRALHPVDFGVAVSGP